MRKLYKTTIVIWSDFDTEMFDIESLGFEANHGQAYNSQFKTELIDKPENDPEWDGTEFFDEAFNE